MASRHQAVLLRKPLVGHHYLGPRGSGTLGDGEQPVAGSTTYEHDSIHELYHYYSGRPPSSYGDSATAGRVSGPPRPGGPSGH